MDRSAARIPQWAATRKARTGRAARRVALRVSIPTTPRSTKTLGPAKKLGGGGGGGGGRPPPPPAGPCSEPGENCLETKCCVEPGQGCYEKSKYWASCKDSCTPGIDPNDPPKYQDPWTCRLVGGSPGGGGSRPPPPRSRRRYRPRPSPPPPSGGGGGGGGGGGSKQRSGKTKGHLTMWANNDALIGSQCEYANAPVNSKTDPMLPSYLRTGFHCAIGDSNPAFGKGENR